MEFLKKHYEKILLSLVLLGLALVAVWLPAAINGAREDLQKSIINLPEPIVLKPGDLSTNEAALRRLQNPPVVDLAGTHNLFNPVTWKVKPDGTFLKIVREGVDALTITKIEPLYMELAFDRVAGAGIGYWIGVKRQSKKVPPVYAKLNEKKDKDLFTLKEVKGAPEDPDELVLELADNLQLVSITKEKPFRRIEGYSVDLRYEADSQNLPRDRKVNDVITFGGESYKIIAITENEVRVSAISTDKRKTIFWKDGAR